VAPGRSAPIGGRFARWYGQERAPNREPSQGSTDEVRTSLSRVRFQKPHADLQNHPQRRRPPDLRATAASGAIA
jgi:hypothetical protein